MCARSLALSSSEMYTPNDTAQLIERPTTSSFFFSFSRRVNNIIVLLSTRVVHVIKTLAEQRLHNARRTNWNVQTLFTCTVKRTFMDLVYDIIICWLNTFNRNLFSRCIVQRFHVYFTQTHIHILTHTHSKKTLLLTRLDAWNVFLWLRLHFVTKKIILST